MITTLVTPSGPSSTASACQPPSTPPPFPSSSNINKLLSPTTTTHHHPPSTSSSANKRKSSYMDDSPRKSRSPSKPLPPRTPDAPATASRGSPHAPLSSSRTALNHLLNDEDRPPRSAATSIDPDPDADAVDADVLMHEDDEPEGRPGGGPRRGDEEDEEEQGEGEEEDGESDDDDDEEDDDEDDDDEDSGDESDGSDIEVTGQSEATNAAAVRVKSEPADPAAAPEGTEDSKEAGTDAAAEAPKKKKTKRPRRESMDEDLPPPPPPMPTIRIEVPFGQPGDTVDFNFREVAHEAGYEVVNPFGDDYNQAEEPTTAAPTAPDTTMAPTPANGAGNGAPPDGPRGPVSFMDLVDADPLEMQRLAAEFEAKYEDQPKKKARAKKKRVIDYDLNDPFIDDSDLKIDAPTHIARPKKEGFFVHQGALELMEESPHRLKSRSKPKASKKEIKEPRKSLSEALRLLGSAREPHNGSANSPILIDSDNENAAPYVTFDRSPSPSPDPLDDLPVDRGLYKNASREPKYLPPFNEFPEELAHRLRALRRESHNHRWDVNNKGKFPEHLKPGLQRAGEAAFHHDLLCIVDKDQTDSNFERYHEKSFVTALTAVLPYNKLTLGKLVLKLCYPVYWRWLVAREEEGLRQWKILLEPEIQPMIELYEKDVARVAAAPDEPIEVDGAESADGAKKKEPTEAKKIPTFTQDMKDIFRQLVENTQEQVDINKKMEEWNQRIEGQSSELNMRKFLYTKIINMYPEGYMTSLALSRAFTNFKRSGQGAKAMKEDALAAAQQ